MKKSFKYREWLCVWDEEQRMYKRSLWQRRTRRIFKYKEYKCVWDDEGRYYELFPIDEKELPYSYHYGLATIKKVKEFIDSL
jgi:hypothetical protein